jgi:hypothetical protein
MQKPEPSTLTITVAVDPSLGDVERYRHDAERILAFVLTLLANDTRPTEIRRRLRGYEPRDVYEVSP